MAGIKFLRHEAYNNNGRENEVYLLEICFSRENAEYFEDKNSNNLLRDRKKGGFSTYISVGCIFVLRVDPVEIPS